MDRNSDIDQWWPQLSPNTRTWLIDNNGDVVPPAILQEIEDAGGTPSEDAWWFGSWEGAEAGFLLSDSGIDWIESFGNGELPD